MIIKSLRNNLRIALLVLFSFAVFSLLTVNHVAASPVDTYQFSDEVTKKRYQALVKELRCPKCQNQNLADSNSPIAAISRPGTT